jgi:chromosome segregation ATPase
VNIEQEIKSLKNQYNNDKLEKAKCEGRLEDLEKKRVEIVQRCNDAGVKPEELPTKIEESKTKLEGLINKAKGLFNSQETPVDMEGNNSPPPAATFGDNAPF